MSLPTRSEKYLELIEHLRKAQEASAMMAHLENAQGQTGTLLAKGWLGISELMKQIIYKVTELTKGTLQ